MAERRMLHKKVSLSGDLAALDTAHGARAVLFYTWLIPHLDRWGCATADPETLLITVGPRWRDTTPQDIDKWLKWMLKRGLLERVKGSNGERGIRVPRFIDHQTGTHFEREAQSRYEPDRITKQWARPDAKRWAIAGESGPGPDQVQTKSGPGPRKGRERKELPFPPTPHDGSGPQDPTPLPEGGHHRLAPRPDDHHEEHANGNGTPPPRHNDDFQTAADVLAAMKQRYG